MYGPHNPLGHQSPASHSAGVGVYWPASISPGSPAPPESHVYASGNSYFPPISQSITPNTLESYSSSSVSAPGPANHAVPPKNPKVAIPRLSAPHAPTDRRRSTRACEPCRQRKIKCDATRPTCGQCVYHKSQCVFEDVKRVRDQRMLRNLTRQVDYYGSLLRSLEGQVDAPTARRIKKALKMKFDGSSSQSGNKDRKADDSDSAASVGSLEAIDVVDEDLNRNEDTRAAGFFGKSSEVSWMQRLEGEVENTRIDHGLVGIETPDLTSQPELQDPRPKGSAPPRERQDIEIPLASMNYHLDDLEIPVINDSNPFVIPPRETADEYFNAYMTYVHPTFSVIRKTAFTAQYLQFFERWAKPPQKWLGILNMIFALGSHYYNLANPLSSRSREDGLVFLTRARQLCLTDNVLFEHADLQQIQLEFLVALYLLCLGQVNRATKLSSMALQSALSLGINLRLTDDRTHDISKEARARLWWSIYSFEHLLASMHGRASCIGEHLCALPAPLPVEEETFDQPEIVSLLQDRTLREAKLCPTLFETTPQSQTGSSWVTECKPCPSLFFYCLVDLSLISQAALNKVYSMEGIRQGPSLTEYRLQQYSLLLDRWLTKVPANYKFIVPDAGPWHVNHAHLDDLNTPFARERVCLALSYYSARITLCRPCFTHSRTPLSPDASPRAKMKTEMATQGLQAACSLISILPEEVDVTWLARVTPGWSFLHFLMQATTIHLLSLLYCTPAVALKTWNEQPGQPTSGETSTYIYPPLRAADINAVIMQTRKALTWIHAMASVDPAARRAFLMSDGAIRRIAPVLQIDLRDWPSSETLAGEIVNDGVTDGGDTGLRMDTLEDLVDFEGHGSLSFE